ncbi:twin-arginine translocase TatA/TatE family subunit [Microbacterium indicum]|uniref:twin-arginine translocase TatA/TatE family subunit n=1 Tax=Microbacterium indicum TaxID=358100 RepID=UPI0003FED5FD|nr:twin-arginine translocase TatA/TatE family subunit [Microbacterium indicum]
MPALFEHPMQLLLILAIVLLIFGASRLPALAKGVGQSMRVFRSELRAGADEQAAAAATTAAAPEQSAAAPLAAEQAPDQRA